MKKRANLTIFQYCLVPTGANISFPSNCFFFSKPVANCTCTGRKSWREKLWLLGLIMYVAEAQKQLRESCESRTVTPPVWETSWPQALYKCQEWKSNNNPFMLTQLLLWELWHLDRAVSLWFARIDHPSSQGLIRADTRDMALSACSFYHLPFTVLKAKAEKEGRDCDLRSCIMGAEKWCVYCRRRTQAPCERQPRWLKKKLKHFCMLIFISE